MNVTQPSQKLGFSFHALRDRQEPAPQHVLGSRRYTACTIYNLTFNTRMLKLTHPASPVGQITYIRRKYASTPNKRFKPSASLSGTVCRTPLTKR